MLSRKQRNHTFKSGTRDEKDTVSWVVTTYNVDGITPRRSLLYKHGDWEERYNQKSTLFGDSPQEVILKRHTSYVPENDASPIQLAHLTVTDGPRGKEEARRYLRGAEFVLRRTFHPPEGSQVESTEVFRLMP